MINETISDEGLGTLMLGLWVGLVHHSKFPVDIKMIKKHRGADGQVESVTIVTRSGLRYRCRIDLEESP